MKKMKIIQILAICCLIPLDAFSNSNATLTVYWAGPHSKSLKASEEISKAQSIAKAADFELVSPSPLIHSSSRKEHFLENLKKMKEADFMVADLSSFRSVSLDGDTAFEMGYMYGLGKPVLGYSRDRALFFNRIVEEMRSRHETVRSSADGRSRDDRGDALEKFDMSDNLMLAGAVEMSHRLLGENVVEKRNLPKTFAQALHEAKSLVKRPFHFDPCLQQPVPNLPRTIPGRLKAVLNGPDVFRMEAKILGLGKNITVDHFKSKDGSSNFTGVFPFDVAVVKQEHESVYQFGTRIFLKDVGNMCASDLSIANMVPYRGPGTDVGTAFEMGFMAAQGKPVLGYSDSGDDYSARVRRIYASKGQKLVRKNGFLIDPQGFVVEENSKETVMLEEALMAHGFGVAPTLESALQNASLIDRKK